MTDELTVTQRHIAVVREALRTGTYPAQAVFWYHVERGETWWTYAECVRAVPYALREIEREEKVGKK